MNEANIKVFASFISFDLCSFHAKYANTAPEITVTTMAMFPTIGFSGGKAHGSKLTGIRNKL